MSVPGLSFEIVRATGLGLRADRTAMIALTERGPKETPTLVQGSDDFAAQFGDPLDGMLGPLAARGYFDNGGEELIVARFVPREAAPAGGAVAVVGATQSQLPFVLPLAARDPGSFGDGLAVETILTVRRRARGLLTSGTHVDGLAPPLQPADAGAPVRVIAGTPAAVQWGRVATVSAGGASLDLLPGVPPGPPDPKFPPPGLPAPTLVEIYEPTFSLRITEPGRADVVVSGLDLRDLDAARALLAPTNLTIPVGTPPLAGSTDVELPIPGRVSLTGGEDGLEAGGNLGALAVSFAACIDALELSELPDIVIAPDLWAGIWGSKGKRSLAFDAPTAIGLADQMVQSAARTRDRVVILDPPLTGDLRRPLSPAELVAWQADRGDKETGLGDARDFAATFTPWVRIAGGGVYRGDDTLLVPPSPYVAGRMARTSRERGPWIATGNVSLERVIGLAERLSIQEQELLQGLGIAPLRMELPPGATIQGVRSLSWPDPDRKPWRFLSTRRLFNFLRRAIRPIGLSYVFEPNAPATWMALRRDLVRLLGDLFARGAFAGRTTDEAFFVEIDDALNPADARDNGVMTALVGVAPALPLEFLVVRLLVEGNTARVAEEAP